MKVRWTPEAASELQEIRDYLLRERPEFVFPTMTALYGGAMSLRQMPLRGRLGNRSGTRELPLQPLPYYIIYRVDEASVIILGFRHTSRDKKPN